ncbi:unnamed protein product [Didymodactylos carnosus]|uniref:Uncharacterized protein n=1 Tax=Didymodactylos carnosus TaxID=1234261 RepID=A0A814NEU3_9BILA|nr:unnamed protein product [Didymodactylos carnosus]CAF3856145.1 unnamed protein product [Didymodactylos carnosus]
MTDQKAIELPALGRPFRLGMLYNLRQDSLIPGVRLWRSEVTEKNTRKTSQISTNYEIITNDSLQEKTKRLGVKGSLKLSVLGGLVNLSGSAEYASDQQKSEHQTRLTLKYSTTTFFEELNVGDLGDVKSNYRELSDVAEATHIVVAILYGAEAFFVFDHNLTNSEDKTTVQGTLEAVIKKIPKLDTGASASLDMNNSEKRLAENLKCKFYGDFRFSENPSTFADAVRVYKNLPKLLGEKFEHAVPKTVWLLPLQLLDSKAERFLRDISSNTVNYCMKLVEQCHSLTVKATDLTKSSVFEHFSQLKEELDKFIESISTCERNMKGQIADLLPEIRGGKREEKALYDCFSATEASPFNYKTLEKWLVQKANEITFITDLTDAITTARGSKAGSNILPNVSFISSPLSTILGKIGSNYVLCLSFQLNEIDEPQLANMKNYLHSNTKERQQLRNVSSHDWLNDYENIAKIRSNVYQFIELAKGHVSDDKIKFVVNEKYLPGGERRVKIVLFKEGLPQDDYNELKKNAVAISFCAQTLTDVFKVNRKIEELWLSATAITDYDFIMLTDELKKNETNLEKLYLYRNPQLTSGSARYLGELIRATTKLSQISMSGANIDSHWATEVASALKVNRSVTVLSLDFCQIGDDGAKALGEMLMMNRKLSCLEVKKNQITDVGAKALASGLKQNSTLLQLRVGGNNFSADSKGGKELPRRVAHFEFLDPELRDSSLFFDLSSG